MYRKTFIGVLFSNYKLSYFARYAEFTQCMSSTIGFVGLGNMGSKMAQNLHKKGEKLIIYDAQPSSLKAFTSKPNVVIASDVKELAAKSSFVITMLPDDDAVWSIYTHKNGIFSNCTNESAVFVDCSTTDPEVARKIWSLANETGRLFLDAPVSGGVVGAEAATLTFMVGGSETIPQPIQSVLLKMGARVINCGSSGMGQVAKLCNNMLLGSTMVAVAETMNLSKRCGLDPKILTSIINTGSGHCWSTAVNNPVPGILPNAPSSREYEGGFKTSLLVKDLKLALNVADKTNLKVPLASIALKIYSDAIQEKQVGDLDFSVIYKATAEK